MGNGQGFHKGGEVGKGDDDGSVKGQPEGIAVALDCVAQPPQHDVGESVVEAEVGMRHQVQVERNLQ
jgi:hypothetical protein